MNNFWKIFPIGIFVLIGMAIYLFVTGVSNPESDDVNFTILLLSGALGGIVGKYIAIPIGEMF